VSEEDILEDEGSGLDGDGQELLQGSTSHDILSCRQGLWGKKKGGLLGFRTTSPELIVPCCEGVEYVIFGNRRGRGGNRSGLYLQWRGAGEFVVRR
jgi:hypothetical protein